MEDRNMEKPFRERKQNRLKEYDCSTAGAYFITVCVQNRKPILWNNVGADSIHPNDPPLSAVGKIVECGILQIPQHYSHISLDKYCVMPDHIHMILRILSDENGESMPGPGMPTIVEQMKRWVSKNVGQPIWQKSYADRVIRNEKGYLAVWEYIDNNPLKMDQADDGIDFSQM